MTELVKTEDGSHTIFVPSMNEHYHSVHGAVGESELIFIGNGFLSSKADPVNIFEVGFGTGLNVLLTAAQSIQTGRKVHYTSIEKYPVSQDLLRGINHWMFAGKHGKELYDKIHNAPWNTDTVINEGFILHKKKGDFVNDKLEGCYDLIYFDAFGPDKQPEMWTQEMFMKVSAVTANSGILVTYSAKGDVKRRLKASGFEVSLLPGPPGKRHMIRAVKL